MSRGESRARAGARRTRRRWAGESGVPVWSSGRAGCRERAALRTEVLVCVRAKEEAKRLEQEARAGRSWRRAAGSGRRRTARESRTDTVATAGTRRLHVDPTMHPQVGRRRSGREERRSQGEGQQEPARGRGLATAPRGGAGASSAEVSTARRGAPTERGSEPRVSLGRPGRQAEAAARLLPEHERRELHRALTRLDRGQWLSCRPCNRPHYARARRADASEQDWRGLAPHRIAR